MIASNYRKYPEAMALQRPLPFVHLLVWATARPGVRILRTIRAARAAAFKAAGRVRQVVKAITPTWWKEAKRQAQALAQQIREACLALVESEEPANAWQCLDLAAVKRRAANWPSLTHKQLDACRVRDGKRLEWLDNGPTYQNMCTVKCGQFGGGKMGEYSAYWGGEST